MDHLASTQRALYREVMLDNYWAVAFLRIFPFGLCLYPLEFLGSFFLKSSVVFGN